MSADVPERTVWGSKRVDGVVMVPIADVLNWLRALEAAWQTTRPESPSRVAGHIADELRDVWLDGTDRREEWKP